MFELISESRTDALQRTLAGTGVASLVLTLALHGAHPAAGGPALVDPAPVERLATATTFVAPGGYGGVSVEVKAWRTILESPGADDTFKRLLNRATTGAGQLYALAGLYHTDREYFYSVVPPFLMSDLVVAGRLGCEYGGWYVSTVAAQIERGVLPGLSL
jgi:hypothetical protein